MTIAKGVILDVAYIFKEWSGLSDLATYSIMFAWLLTPPEGHIAFVMSNRWMEREYGNALRHFVALHGTIRGIVRQGKGNGFH
jgi:hypothetical protein